jgi:ABC-2 type transport system ATP-binding protein
LLSMENNAMEEKVAIRTVGLRKSYGPIPALRGVDLTVPTGEIFGFLGPNGAGKTTTIRCLLDLIRPDAGAIRVLGIDPQVDPVTVRRRTGYLPGELSLEQNLTAATLLRYLVELQGDEVEWSFVQRLAERLELNLERPIKNLSKGNKQKVGVIQALMARPTLLLLDEPTAGLDPLMQQEVYRLLREAREAGATVFFSSHIIGEVEALADRVAILRDGVVVEEATPKQLTQLTVRRVHVHFCRPVDVQGLERLPGVSVAGHNGEQATLQVEGKMDALVKALAAYPISDLSTESVSLEQIFLTYYGAGRPAQEVD